MSTCLIHANDSYRLDSIDDFYTDNSLFHTSLEYILNTFFTEN